MNILLSIKPVYAEKILSGSKQFEFRKVVPKNNEINKVVIYATKPVGKILGEFTIEKTISDTPETLWNETKNHSGITKDFFDSYFKNRQIAHAFKIDSFKRYDEPLDLESTTGYSHPPQSFVYIKN